MSWQHSPVMHPSLVLVVNVVHPLRMMLYIRSFLQVMASFGKEGLNAKQLADKYNQDPLRVRKFIKDYGKLLKRTGKRAGTQFFLP